MKFDNETGSIYKRAARSFDLFLALQLKPMLDKIPVDVGLARLDQLDSKPGGSSEALEFALPMETLRRLVNPDITNQELINRSMVLGNGVRIALNLQFENPPKFRIGVGGFFVGRAFAICRSRNSFSSCRCCSVIPSAL